MAAGWLFYEAFKAMPIGVALENLEGQPLFVNQALCSMLGFSEEEMRQKHCVDFSPGEDAEKDWALFQQLRAGAINHYSLDKRFIRGDGSIVWGRLSISMLNSDGLHLVVAMVEDITEKRLAQEELQRSEANLQKLTGHLLRAQEEERARIARELHDDINQRLALVTVRLDRLKQDAFGSTTEFRRELTDITKQADELAQDIQALSHRLHSSRLDQIGLAGAAANLCRQVAEIEGIQIECQAEEIPRHLPKELSLCLFRVLQESLQNAAKHSRSRKIRVALAVRSGEIQLAVLDWGVGFDLGQALAGDGLGLASMRERLKLVGGELYIESERACGTVVRASVPVRIS